MIYGGAQDCMWASIINNEIPQLRVYAIEANPIVYVHNFRRIDKLGYTYINAALSTNCGVGKLYIPIEDVIKNSYVSKIDSIVFKRYHNSSKFHRENWRTDASLHKENLSTNITRIVEIPLIDLNCITREKENQFLFLDCQGEDIYIIERIKSKVLRKFIAIVFEVENINKSR